MPTFMPMDREIRILVCPLDWGLGHAVRCVPIIRTLVAVGATPVIAADGEPLAYLRNEFPELEYVVFDGVTVKYPEEGGSMIWSMLRQIPAQLCGIRKETDFVERIVAERKIDAIISDNRFGAYSNKVPSVYITHQIHIQTGNTLTDAVARKIHAWFMVQFVKVWIPDMAENEGISGKLAHGGKIPSHAEYIGLLTRFGNKMDASKEKKFDVSFILSGPEPQRSLLEQKIIAEAGRFPRKKMMLVRGKTSAPVVVPENMQQMTIADAKTVLELYETSEHIVCRSGYTSIMELISAGRSALLVPTLGQTEQEYLAEYLRGKFSFACISQQDFSLDAVWNTPQLMTGTDFMQDRRLLEKAVLALLKIA